MHEAKNTHIWIRPQYPQMGLPFVDTLGMHRSPRQIAADRLSYLMERTPALDTLKKVSAKSGVGYGTIQRIKTAEVAATIDKLGDIAAAFGLRIDQFFNPEQATARTATVACEPGAPWKTVREQRIDAINGLLAQMDDYGLVAMLEKAKDVARDYPRATSSKAS